MSREVFIVSGMASKGANIAPLRLLAAQHEDADTVHYIDGATLVDDRFVAATPSEQTMAIEAVLEAAPPDRQALIYAQSMGALAAVKCLESRPGGTVRAVAIAPPLPSPSDILRHDRIRGRLEIRDGQMILPSYSFALGDSGPSGNLPAPVDVHLDDAYFQDVDSQSAGFFDRVRNLSAAGFIKLVLPSRDWNSSALTMAGGLPGATVVDGGHSLHADHRTMVATAAFLRELAEPLSLAA